MPEDGGFRVPPVSPPPRDRPNSISTSSHAMPKPDNNLLWGILTTIFCCLPLGIVSIISATKVDNLWNSGQHEAALVEAKKAKNWAIYAAIAGAIVAIIYVIAVGLDSAM